MNRMAALYSVLLVTSVIMLVVVVQVRAIPFISECVNDTHLREYLNLNVSGTEIPIEAPLIHCPYGCEEDTSQYGDDCSPPPMQQNIIWVGVIAFLIFIVYLARRR